MSSELPRPKVTRENSIRITLCQDIFNEIANLIGPIARRLALDTKIEEQHITKDVPLLGKAAFATASNVSIAQFDIEKVLLLIEDGFLSVVIDDVDAQIHLDLNTIGGNLGRVEVTLELSITAKVRLNEVEGKLKTDVYDVKVKISKFDNKIGTGYSGKLLSSVLELLEVMLKGLVQSALSQPIDDALTGGLDSVLGRDWDVTGNVSSIFYRLNVDFMGNPTISKANGVELLLAIDSFVKDKSAQEAAAGAKEQ